MTTRRWKDSDMLDMIREGCHNGNELLMSLSTTYHRTTPPAIRYAANRLLKQKYITYGVWVKIMETLTTIAAPQPQVRVQISKYHHKGNVIFAQIVNRWSYSRFAVNTQFLPFDHDNDTNQVYNQLINQHQQTP